MSRERESVLATDGPAAPPRANGEIVFDAPWQSRIFGLTLALYEDGRFEWKEFQARLIEAIAVHERELESRDDGAGDGDDDADGAYDYWSCWQEAFRSLASDHGWLDADALGALEAELRARPAGHDH